MGMHPVKTTKHSVTWGPILACLLILLCGGGARATAPRFGPKLIKPEATIKIYAYQLPPLVDAQTPSAGMAAAIVQAAFQEEGVPVEIEVLPAKSLARRSVLYDGAAGLLAEPFLFSRAELEKLAVLPCYSMPLTYYYFEQIGRASCR